MKHQASLSAKQIFPLLILYLVSLALGSAVFIASFWLPFLESLDFLFYRAAALLFLTCGFVAILLIVLKTRSHLMRSVLTYRDIALIFVLLFSGNWFVYGTIPFNVSRSNSVLVLSYLYTSGPKSEKEITEYVKAKYFDDYGAIKIRLHEQSISGTIESNGDNFVLTPKGRATVEKLAWFSDLYKVKRNFLRDAINGVGNPK